MSITIPTRVEPLEPREAPPVPRSIAHSEETGGVNPIGPRDENREHADKDDDRPDGQEALADETNDATIVHLSREAAGAPHPSPPIPEKPSGASHWIQGGIDGGHWHFEHACPYCAHAAQTYRRQSVPPPK